MDRRRYVPALKAFGATVARYRRGKGLTQDDLADAVGVSGTYISELECGKKSPTLSVVLAIGAALERNGGDLLLGLDGLVLPLED